MHPTKQKFFLFIKGFGNTERSCFISSLKRKFSRLPDNEEDTNDGDEDSPNQQPSAANAKENAGTRGGILSPKARERMFPILLMELTKQSIVPESASQQLLERFQKTDPIIFAALDVYDLDGDMAELVDTLARIAATAE